MDDLVEGHVYRATLPNNRKSPREYAVLRVVGTVVTIRYGWFGWEGSAASASKKRATPDDPWTWSPRGAERHSRFDFNEIEDLGPVPEEGKPRKKFDWAMEILG